MFFIRVLGQFLSLNLSKIWPCKKPSNSNFSAIRHNLRPKLGKIEWFYVKFHVIAWPFEKNGVPAQFWPKEWFSAFGRLKILKIQLNSQTEKPRSKNWSGWAFLVIFSYESLTFWKKWSAGMVLAPSVILSFWPKTAQKICNFRKKKFSESCFLYTLMMGKV